MKRLKYILAAVLLFASCRDKGEIINPEILATMDQIVEDNGEGKVVLYHTEEWLKWEEQDKVAIHSINGSDKYADIKDFEYISAGDGPRHAFFHNDGGIVEGEKYHAVYPADIKNNSIGGNAGNNDLKVNLAAERAYRPSGHTYSDSSFGIGAIPMVAYNGTSDINAIKFHMVAGIMRLQFWGQSATPYKIKELSLQSVNIAADGIDDGDPSNAKALSGEFSVNRLIFPNPYLQSRMVAAGSDDTKVKYIFEDDGRTLGTTGGGQLWTLYIPMPAQAKENEAPTTYKLYMTLKLQSGSTTKYLKKGISVDIRRQNITMIPALGFDESDLSDSPEWTTSASGVDVGLVGNGTKDRPYRIYTAKELDLVRKAFNMAEPTINGQVITEDTYFEIVRSDIHLLTIAQRDSIAGLAIDTTKRADLIHWHDGIHNFKGHMQFRSSSTVYGGIMNTTGVPLFYNITEQGHIERIQMRGNITYTGTALFSPLCRINRGTMTDCHVKCNVRATHASALGIAGLCVDNYGTIVGGANEAALRSANDVCGCVYNNYGTVQGSFSLSSAIPEGANIAGICMHNYGTMQYCQVESNVDPQSSGNWGVIAFYNHRDTTVNGNSYPKATVDRCISSGSVVFSTSGSIGGIVNVNDGIVKNCSNKVTLRGATGNIGGIVATMRGGEVYNCDAVGSHWIDGTGGANYGHVAENAGGIVGNLKAGSIKNCYNQCRVDGGINSGGIVGNFDAGADIQNCWSAFGHNFIGSNSATGTVGEFCFSAHLEDFARGCNTLDTASGVRYDIHQMQTAQNEEYKAENGGEDLTSKYISFALNYWVGKQNTASDGGTYYTWTTVENTMPRLNMPNSPTKSKQSGYRPRSPRRTTGGGTLPSSTQRRFNERITRK